MLPLLLRLLLLRLLHHLLHHHQSTAGLSVHFACGGFGIGCAGGLLLIMRSFCHADCRPHPPGAHLRRREREHRPRHVDLVLPQLPRDRRAGQVAGGAGRGGRANRAAIRRARPAAVL